MNYKESKKVLDKIASKYSCMGSIIMRTAVQYIIEYGQNMFKDEEFIKDQKQQINDKHNTAEKEKKVLFVSRNFELALIDCAKELADIDTYDLVIYMQKEMFWSCDGGLDYSRAIELLKHCMNWIEQQTDNNSENLDTFEYIGFNDDELEAFGFGYMISNEEEDE